MEGSKIKKAKITSLNYLDVIFFESEMIEGQEVTSRVHKECKWDVHEDLKKAFDKLKFHMAMLCKVISTHDVSKEMDQHPELLELIVTSFIVGGEGETAGVTIVGKRFLDAGRVLNIVSPFTKFDDEHSPYDYGFELSEAVDGCIAEVKLYLGGKTAPIEPEERKPTQGNLFVDGSGDLSGNTDDTHELLDPDEM